MNPIKYTVCITESWHSQISTPMTLPWHQTSTEPHSETPFPQGLPPAAQGAAAHSHWCVARYDQLLKKSQPLDPKRPKQTGSSAETLTAHSMARRTFTLVAQHRVRAHTGNVHRYRIRADSSYEQPLLSMTSCSVRLGKGLDIVYR